MEIQVSFKPDKMAGALLEDLGTLKCISVLILE